MANKKKKQKRAAKMHHAHHQMIHDYMDDHVEHRFIHKIPDPPKMHIPLPNCYCWPTVEYLPNGAIIFQHRNIIH